MSPGDQILEKRRV